MSVRTFANVRPSAWLESPLTSILEQHGPRTLLVAVYLQTAPESHMSGVYMMPASQLSRHLRLTTKQAETELQKLIDCRFIQYDWDTELVWVVDMAKDQVGQGRRLNPRDNKTKNVVRYLRGLPSTPLVDAFLERYPLDLCPEVQQ